MPEQIHPSSGNVFVDLGFDAEEAQNLKIRSDLMIEIAKLIEARRLTQAEAAELLGVSQPRISGLVRGKIDRFSVDTLIEQLVDGKPDVSGDLPKQRGRDIATRVKRNRGPSTIQMTVLPMGAALPNLLEAEPQQQSFHFTGFQDRHRPHCYATRIVWSPTNSDSSSGSPSSRSMPITSRRFSSSSSSVAP